MKAGGFHSGFMLGLFFDPEDGGDLLADFPQTTQHYITEGRTHKY
jgi:hypothetical protein